MTKARKIKDTKEWNDEGTMEWRNEGTKERRNGERSNELTMNERMKLQRD